MTKLAPASGEDDTVSEPLLGKSAPLVGPWRNSGAPLCWGPIDVLLEEQVVEEMVRELIPLGRMGTKTDIAFAAVYLCSAAGTVHQGGKEVFSGGGGSWVLWCRSSPGLKFASEYSPPSHTSWASLALPQAASLPARLWWWTAGTGCQVSCSSGIIRQLPISWLCLSAFLDPATMLPDNYLSSAHVFLDPRAPLRIFIGPVSFTGGNVPGCGPQLPREFVAEMSAGVEQKSRAMRPGEQSKSKL